MLLRGRESAEWASFVWFVFLQSRCWTLQAVEKGLYPNSVAYTTALCPRQHISVWNIRSCTAQTVVIIRIIYMPRGPDIDIIVKEVLHLHLTSSGFLSWIAVCVSPVALDCKLCNDTYWNESCFATIKFEVNNFWSTRGYFENLWGIWNLKKENAGQ